MLAADGGGVTAEPKTEAQQLQVTVAPTATDCHGRLPRITAELPVGDSGCGCCSWGGSDSESRLLNQSSPYSGHATTQTVECFIISSQSCYTYAGARDKTYKLLWHFCAQE